jgi:hypothetical protein
MITLVSFVSGDDVDILINPQHVAAIQADTERACLIILASGERIGVKSGIEDAAAKITSRTS